SGSFLIREEYRIALMVGLFGGFTTFSSFGLETLSLINDGQAARAILNIVFSVGLGLTAVWIGYRLAEACLGV
ncbi:MAG: fluoride efflux transporter FluC, partial [Phycisphaerae bacterium]